MATRTRETQPTTESTPPRDAEYLTLHEAATLLNEDRSYLVPLLDAGAIPSTGKGRQRHIRRDDLLAYMHKRDAIRAQALDDLSLLSQEAGLDQIDFAAYRATLS